MIPKQEIIDAATRYGLLPNIVEKDYVLGWLLAGISNHDAFRETWVFKGGTCLKKCFFETYRFSEDLDFTLKDEAHIDADFLTDAFGEIGDWIYDQSGIAIPRDGLRFDVFENPRGNPSCQGRVSYQGPISPTKGGLPRVKLDLTADEHLVLDPVTSSVFHPYSDEPDAGISLMSYAYEEAFSEKIRALGERTRPRDLYDVVNLYRLTDARPPAATLLNVLRAKCEFKEIAVPTITAIERHRDAVEAAWEQMLRHQLPVLPPVAVFWNELPAFFDWLMGAAAPAALAPVPRSAGDALIRERRLNLGVGFQAESAMEVVRFAAANRLRIDIDYTKLNGERTQRRIEPYSLRRSQAGDILLHGFDVQRQEMRSYRVERINSASAAGESFTPRYEIELTSTGALPIRDNPPREERALRVHTSPVRRRSIRRSSTGPTHIYECSYCGKRFRRKARNSKLNKHNDKSGYPCPGRTGFYVDTKY
ncbi:nucleotidyl transferase AbiEii/AbiGii toxin family protein [Hyphococcus sp.]|uniref:nucleotidyl transferase AbiEii/AbiGii toxin family protein n=1 Tax=Hyphococcus sp. TaxID=2038636 RepID=UPI0035C7317B